MERRNAEQHVRQNMSGLVHPAATMLKLTVLASPCQLPQGCTEGYMTVGLNHNSLGVEDLRPETGCR